MGFLIPFLTIVHVAVILSCLLPNARVGAYNGEMKEVWSRSGGSGEDWLHGVANVLLGLDATVVGPLVVQFEARLLSGVTAVVALDDVSFAGCLPASSQSADPETEYENVALVIGGTATHVLWAAAPWKTMQGLLQSPDPLNNDTSLYAASVLAFLPGRLTGKIVFSIPLGHACCLFPLFGVVIDSERPYLVDLAADSFTMRIKLTILSAPSKNHVALRVVFNATDVAGSFRIFVRFSTGSVWGSFFVSSSVLQPPRELFSFSYSYRAFCYTTPFLLQAGAVVFLPSLCSFSRLLYCFLFRNGNNYGCSPHNTTSKASFTRRTRSLCHDLRCRLELSWR